MQYYDKYFDTHKRSGHVDSIIDRHAHYFGSTEPNEPPDLGHGHAPDGAELHAGRWYAVHTH